MWETTEDQLDMFDQRPKKRAALNKEAPKVMTIRDLREIPKPIPYTVHRIDRNTILILND